MLYCFLRLQKLVLFYDCRFCNWYQTIGLLVCFINSLVVLSVKVCTVAGRQRLKECWQEERTFMFGVRQSEWQIGLFLWLKTGNVLSNSCQWRCLTSSKLSSLSCHVMEHSSLSCHSLLSFTVLISDVPFLLVYLVMFSSQLVLGRPCSLVLSVSPLTRLSIVSRRVCHPYSQSRKND